MTFHSPSLHRSRGEGSVYDRQRTGDSNSEPHPLLDAQSAMKMENLINDYDRLLQSQLQDQQLYYEKLLARETVRVLELSYTGSNSKTQVAHKMDKKGLGLRGSGTSAVKGEGRGSGNSAKSSAEVSPRLFAAVNSISNASIVTISEQLRALEDTTKDLEEEENAAAMREIEVLKIDISNVEVEYRVIIDSIKECATETAQQKRANDKLLQTLKAQQAKEKKLITREESVRNISLASCMELDQQIQDLLFYQRTRKKVQHSSALMQCELQGGTVTVAEGQKSKEEGTGSGSGKNGGKSKGRKKR